jgi:BirA family transcriptional regulator, biotin operon repressor / biotin---[acetyl-CoA-carboxylase] ligase
MDWQPARLQQQLQELLQQHGGDASAWPVVVDAVAEVDSTNTRLLAHAQSDAVACCRVLVADQQTAGRGRMGRAWQSSPGTSLTFSVSLPQPKGSSAALSLAVAAAVAEALDSSAAGPEGAPPPQIMLKWPNDLWLLEVQHAAGGRKCAGILIESTSASKPPARTLVIGLGINIARPELDALEGAGYGAAGLCELPEWSQAWQQDPLNVAVRAFHAAVGAVVRAVLNEAAQGADAWHASYTARDLLRGRQIRLHAHQGDGAELSVARGIDRLGALLVERSDGQIVPIVSGEVSVRLV